jgi:hypothetical protein
MTLADCSALNFNQCFVLAVESMKMLGRVLAIIETDADALETADFRHESDGGA